MIQDAPPTTITGLLTGEDPKPLKPRFVRAVLRCAFLAAPMLTLMLTIGAYQLDQHYRVIHSFQVQTQFVEQGGALKDGVLIVGTFESLFPQSWRPSSCPVDRDRLAQTYT